MDTPEGPNLSRLNGADTLVLAASAVILAGFRLHAFPAPLEHDECNYAYFAQRLLAGERLYVDVWDHQPPGMFAFLTVPTALFGSAPEVYRTLALLACLATLALLFDIARRCFGRAASWAAALLFALVSSDPGTAGEGCNREIYMNVLLLAALWTLLASRRVKASRRVYPGGPENATALSAPDVLRTPWAPIFLAGLLMGIASTFKTVVAANWLVFAPVVVFTMHPGGMRSGSIFRLKAFLAFGAGPALIWLGIWIYFAATGRSSEFIDAVFSYNLLYSKAEQGVLPKLLAFFAREQIFSTALPLWLAGGVGLAALPWRRDPRCALLGVALAAGSYLAICLPGQFWPHYYLLMLPTLTLLAAALVNRVHAFNRVLGTATGTLIAGALLVTQVSGYLLVPPDRIAWDRYKDRMVWVRGQAARVASVTDPNDTIYIWSADAGFYYYSGRRCASRYTMFGPPQAPHSSTAQRRRLLIDDLRRAKPRVILIILSHPPCPELQDLIFDQKYVSAGLDPGRMEILCDIERPIPPLDWTWQPRE